MKPTYVFDLDGTLADLAHRLHFIKPPKGQEDGFEADWKAFYGACHADEPIKETIGLYRDLWEANKHMWKNLFVIASGRSEDCRYDTVMWLKEQGIEYDALYMRAKDDHRADHIVKREMLAQMRGDGFEPIMAFDDRQQVVDLWRGEGIRCLQVAAEDF